MRKLALIILALVAVIVAVFSYQKHYARKNVSLMLNEARLTATTKTALSLNRHLKNTKIDVAVSGGTVTLSGAVGSEIQKQLAGEVARSIKGASKIQNNLVVSKALLLKPTTRERSLGERLDDLTIEASVKTALMLNENVRSRRIGVSSTNGRVTLTGKVGSAAEGELARKIAEDVKGVVSVESRIALEEADEEEGERSIIEKVDDVRVVAQVRAALMVNRNLDSSEIEVMSRGGVVTLSGIVRSGAEKDLAQKVTEDCRGVKGVVNELRIMQRR